MNCNTTHYRANSSSVPGDPTFLAAVERDGWPPEGVQRHVETFLRAVQPELEAGRRVAYFWVDALRYEMGRGLADELRALGEVRLAPVAGTLPATTPCGMAALLPGAETSYRLETVDGEAVPSVAGERLPGSPARMEFLRRRYGNRFADTALGDLLSWADSKVAATTADCSLFVVRTQDIDGIGENLHAYEARRWMGTVLADLRKATLRLARAGFESFVFAGDHGHVLLPDVDRGEIVARPPGDWLKVKRRSLLGSLRGGRPAGVRVLPAARAGIPTDAPDLVVPAGFCVFTAGETYFHEGISLQECLVPLVSLHVEAAAPPEALGRVTLSYRSDRFTGYIVSIKAVIDASLDTSLSGSGGTGIPVRIEAFAGSGARARPVGEAADCDARNPETKLVSLVPGREVSVPVRIAEGLADAEVEIRASDPTTGRTLGTLRLKNAVQE